MAESLRVLVVADDAELRESLVTMLRSFCIRLNHQKLETTFQVEESAVDKESLTFKESGLCPDFFILDLSSSGVSSSECLIEFRRKWPKCYILLIASDDIPIHSLSEFSTPYDNYLLQPFSIDELRYAMTLACEERFSSRDTAQDQFQYNLDLFSIMAHELKAPLAAIEGYLMLIQDKKAGDKPELYAQMIFRSIIRAQELRSIINDVLTLGRIRKEKKTPSYTEVDLAKVSHAALELVQLEADKRQIACRYHGPDSLIYLADPREMAVLLNNLLTNAVKYNVLRGTVEVTLQSSRNHIELTVSDSGIGIPEKEQGNLFHEFVRVTNEKTQPIAGTGLGLYIIKTILQFYKGKVRVTSAENKGTTVTIILPR